MSEPPPKKRSKRAKSDYHHEVGARIVEARKERGLTQQELADLLHISQRTMQNWETGESLVPHKHRPTLSSKLHRSVSWILRGVEGPPPETQDEMNEWLVEVEERIDERLSKLDRSLGAVAVELRKLEQQIRGLSQRLDDVDAA